MYARVLSVIYVLLAIATGKTPTLPVYSARYFLFTVAQGRRWYATEVSGWITQEKVPASWEDARRRCERDCAVLASPLNTQLYNYLQSRLNVQNDTVAYFIGTRASRSDDGQEVHYVSVEGWRLDDMPMALFDAIQQLDLEQGDCLSMDRHGIRAVSCWDHLSYICYSNETIECGSGYKYYPATRSYYKYYNNSRVTWDVANTTCASEGAYVVVLNDAEEADIVARIVKDGGGDYYLTWTGLRDQRPGGVMNWRTVQGEPLSDVYNVWYDGRPSNNAGRTCAYFYTNNKRLNDWPCDGARRFTCEISHQ